MPAHAANPLYSTDYLYTKGSGRMMGIMIAFGSTGGMSSTRSLSSPSQEPEAIVVKEVGPADESAGGGRMHVLKAFSGQMTESWHVPG